MKLRQMIPPLAARSLAGRTVQAGDYKQKKSLVIAFLHDDCPRCEDYLARLAARAAELAEREAAALVIFSVVPSARLTDGLPREIVAAVEMSGHAQREFLGREVAAAGGLGVLVTDRYGELHAQWSGANEDALPAIGDVLARLAQVQIACEEC